MSKQEKKARAGVARTERRPPGPKAASSRRSRQARQEPRPPTESCAPDMRGALVVCAVTLICLLPFLGKAFHIDDPLFIWSAKHIAHHPLNPYGLPVNWYGVINQMSEVTKNPPGAPYYLALAGSLFGWSEAALHSAMLLPALAAALGTFLLAAKFCNRPVEAALAAVLTPVFLISSTNVMCDTMMLAFFVWAMLLWMAGLEKNKHGYLALSAFLIGICTLTKYYGGVLIGLLIVYSLMKKRKLGWWLAYFLITAAILTFYQLATLKLYGKGLLLDAASYASAARGRYGVEWAAKALIGLSFTGACMASVLFYAGRLWSWKRLAAAAAAGLILMAALAEVGGVASFRFDIGAGTRWGLVAQVSLWVMLGLGILALAATDFLKRKDAESVTLGLWVVGTFVFAAFANWTVNGRTILPMAPAVGILMMRRMQGLGQDRRAWLRVAPLIGAAVLALLVARSDCVLAGLARKAAQEIEVRYAPSAKTVWYEGHWGFQYYMDGHRFKPIDFRSVGLYPGDIVILPENNTNVQPLPDWAWELRDTIELGPGRRLTTMSGAIMAGFYADVYGPLAYAFGEIPPERYAIYDIRAPLVSRAE